MKATGIVRRFDDLGRIVIPKEIRRQLTITENAAMELFTDKGNIVLRKYVPETDFKRSVDDLQTVFYELESYFSSETAGKIEEHIKALKEIVKESEEN